MTHETIDLHHRPTCSMISQMQPAVHRSIQAMRDALAEAHASRSPVILVPTMGALHEGHATLIREAARLASAPAHQPNDPFHTNHPDAASPRIVVSIFVNPLQFGPKEDFTRYPRQLDADVQAAAAAGATDIFAPTPEEFTPAGITTAVDPGPLADTLCGPFRPGHFRGVCTIVLKLFNAVQPTHAMFGWKDAQQFIILRKMVRDLNLPIEMIGVETVREPDGLAMSSRNAYLQPEQRKLASALHRTLRETKEALHAGSLAYDNVDQFGRERLNEAGIAQVDYIQAVDATTLQPLQRPAPAGATLLAAAVRVGQTRLIDNLRF